MSKEIKYTPKEKILKAYNYARGVIDTIQYGGAGASFLAGFGKYFFDSTPDNFTFKERLFYGGALTAGAAILVGGKMASNINKKRALKKLEKISE